MEGIELHPIRGTDGVNQFDPDEVDAVARGEAGAKPHRIADLTERGLLGDVQAESRIAELESVLAREREANAASLERLRRDMGEREKRAQSDADARELAAVLNSLTDDDLAFMNEQELDELAQLLEAADG